MATQTRKEFFKKSVVFGITATNLSTSKTSAEVFTKLDFPDMNNSSVHSYVKILQYNSGHKKSNLILNSYIKN